MVGRLLVVYFAVWFCKIESSFGVNFADTCACPDSAPCPSFCLDCGSYDSDCISGKTHARCNGEYHSNCPDGYEKRPQTGAQWRCSAQGQYWTMYHCHRYCLGITTGKCNLCQDGYYGFNSDQTCALCEAGRYCNEGIDQGPCAKGHYCESGSTSATEEPCPPGTYGGEEGLEDSSCSGLCTPGYWCESGSEDLKQRECRAGQWGGAGQTNEFCSGACSAGYYCPIASSNSKALLCGNSSVYCVEGSAEPTLVDPGFYSTPESQPENVRTSQTICPKGHFCSEGVKRPCPSGRFSASIGATDCLGLCAAGYFCPEQSTSPTANPCHPDPLNPPSNPAQYFCPEGTPAPVEVLPGYFSIPENAPSNQRTGQQLADSSVYLVQNGKRVRKVAWQGDCATNNQAELTVLEYTNAGNGDGFAGANISQLVVFDNIRSEFLNSSFIQILDAAGDGSILSQSSNSAECIAFVTSSGFPFEITNSNGLFVKSEISLDFETCERFVFQLKATSLDGSTTATCSMVIAIANNNDKPYFEFRTNPDYPYALPDIIDFYVNERSEPNTGVGAPLRANDEDVGQEIFFEIIEDTLDGPEQMFYIGSCSGQLYVQKYGLDFVQKKLFQLSIKVCDDPKFFGPMAVPECSVTANVSIHVEDINDNPFWDSETYAISHFEVPENSPPGTLLVPFCGEAQCTGGITGLQVGDLDLQPDGSSETDTMLFTITRNVDNAFAVVSCERNDNLDLCGDESGVAGSLYLTSFASLNFEKEQFFTITIRVNDGRGGVNTTNVEIRVTDANDAPQWPDQRDQDFFEFRENDNMASASIFATDEDPVDILAYFVAAAYDSSGIKVNDLFEMENNNNISAPESSSVTLELQSGKTLDFEESESFQVTVVVHDAGGLQAERNFTVVVGDVNEPPSIETTVLFVDENVPFGTLIEEPLSFTDPDNGQSAFFTLLNSHDGDNFAVNALSGNISIRTALNFEEKQNYTIAVSVTDNGVPAIKTTGLVEIVVRDRPEPPTFVANQLFFFTEASSYNNSWKDLILVEDEDDGDNATLSIISQVFLSSGRPAYFFEIDGLYLVQNSSHGELPNFESTEFPRFDEKAIILRIQGTDMEGLQSETHVQVEILDANDRPILEARNASVTKHVPNLDPCTIDEFCLPGLEVVRLFEYLSDEDIRDDERVRKITYTITDGNSDGTFNVTDGVLVIESVTTNLQNPGHVFVLDITATDHDLENPLTSEVATFYITVVDKNNRPVIGSFIRTLTENVDFFGIVVEDVQARDPDETIMIFTMAEVYPSIASSHFFVDPNNGTLFLTSPLDYETSTTDGKIVVRIKVTDNGGDQSNSNFALGTVEITVIDINEPPTFSQSEYSYTVTEMGVAGPLGTPGAQDPDAVDQGNLVYSLSADVLASPFSVNSATGVISQDGSLNFEDVQDTCFFAAGAVHKCTFVIFLTDTEGNVDNATVSVLVENLNEEPVYQGIDCDSSTSECLNSTTIAVNEDAIGGATSVRLGRFLSTDPDKISGFKLSFAVALWSFEAGEELDGGQTVIDGKFQLDSSGNLFLVDSLDFENRSSYEYEVILSDQGSGGQSALQTSITFTVLVRDTNDVSAVSATTAATPWPAAGGDTVTLTGTNLGPTTYKIANEGAALPTVRAFLVQKSSLQRFEASGCTVVSDTQISCTSSAPGVGADLYWEVFYPETNFSSVLDFSDKSLANRYQAPEITSVSGDAIALPTAGGGSLRISGVNLGSGLPVDPQIRVLYRSSLDIANVFEATECFHSGAEVLCTSAVGSGPRLQFLIEIESQRAEFWFYNETFSHAKPVISNVTIADGDQSKLITSGGSNVDAIVVTGSNFGVSETLVDISLSYGPDEEPAKFIATSCAIVEPHVKLRCIYAPGTGVDLRFTVTADLISSLWSDATLSYFGPRIEGISGPGAENGRTSGGDAVQIKGSGFGPRSPDGITDQNIIATYGGLNATRFTATDCVVVNHDTQITCYTSSGTGALHPWKLNIAGQASEASFGKSGSGSSYSAPTLNYFEGQKMGAVTDGGEFVTLVGLDFGDDSSLVSATFGPNGVEYIAKDCKIDPNYLHSKIKCELPPGIGAELTWTVYVDGQASKVPTTNYKIPVVTNLTGRPLEDGASTEGFENFTIHGYDFGPSILHQPNEFFRFTYGSISGKEYDAMNCTIEPQAPTEIISSIVYRREIQQIRLTGTQVHEIHQMTLTEPMQTQTVIVNPSAPMNLVFEEQSIDISTTNPAMRVSLAGIRAPSISEKQRVQIFFPDMANLNGSFILRMNTFEFENELVGEYSSVTDQLNKDTSAAQLKIALSSLPQFSEFGASIDVSKVSNTSHVTWTITFPVEYGYLPTLDVSASSLSTGASVRTSRLTSGVNAAFRMEYRGKRTRCIRINETGTDVESALEGLTDIPSNSVTSEDPSSLFEISLGFQPLALLNYESCNSDLDSIFVDHGLVDGDFSLRFNTVSRVDCPLCAVLADEITRSFDPLNSTDIKLALEELSNIDEISVQRESTASPYSKRFSIQFVGESVRGNLPELEFVTSGMSPWKGFGASVTTSIEGDSPELLFEYEGSNASRCIAWDLGGVENYLSEEFDLTVSNVAYLTYSVATTKGVFEISLDELSPSALSAHACEGVEDAFTVDPISLHGTFKLQIDRTNCGLCSSSSTLTTLAVDVQMEGALQLALDQILLEDAVAVSETRLDESVTWMITFINGFDGNIPDNMISIVSNQLLGDNPEFAATSVFQQGNEVGGGFLLKLASEEVWASKQNVSRAVLEFTSIHSPVELETVQLDDGVGGVDLKITFAANLGNLFLLECESSEEGLALSTPEHGSSPGTSLTCEASGIQNGTSIIGGEINITNSENQQSLTMPWNATAEELEPRLLTELGMNGTVFREQFPDGGATTWSGGYKWKIYSTRLPRETMILSGASLFAQDDEGPSAELRQPALGLSSAACKTAPGVGAGLRFLAEIANQESDLSQVFLSYKKPEVHGFEPAVGVSDKDFNLKINGENFGGEGVAILFNDIELQVVLHTHRELVVRIPGALQRNQDNKLSISVGGQVVETLYSFGSPQVDSITAVSPPQVLSGPPQEVLIRGTNFGQLVSSVTDFVTVDGQPCIVSEWTHRTILCNITVLDGPLVVQVGEQTCPGGCCPCNFTYAGLLSSPEVTSISHCASNDNKAGCSTQGGYAIQIYGKNLGTSINGKAYIDGNLCTIENGVEDFTETEIQCMVPPGEGYGVVRVQNAWKVSLEDVNFFYDDPSLLSISPGSGPTTGGLNITIDGSNFGITGPHIVFDKQHSCDLVHFDHVSMVCALPEGQGLVDVSVEVNGFEGVNKLQFDYELPEITSIAPREGNTSGMYEMELVGSNFGLLGQVMIGNEVCDEVFYNHSYIICLVPPGAGANLTVGVLSGGRDSNEEMFSYYLPVIDFLEPVVGPTVGGQRVVVHGDNFFNSDDLMVNFGNYSCADPVANSSTMIECNSPEGVGLMLPAIVRVARQFSSDDVFFDFMEPGILQISPFPADAQGGQLMTFFGENFGTESADSGAPGLNVEISGEPCPNPERLADGVITCSLPAVKVGKHVVDLTVAKQHVRVSDNSSGSLFAACTFGFYGQPGELCNPCPQGAVCQGYFRNWHHDPESIEGYGSLNRTLFQPCEPSYACIGNNTCAVGYEHKNERLQLCGVCSDNFYRLEGDCIACPDLAWLILIGCFLVAVLLCSVAYFLTKYGVQLAAVSICIDFCQVVSLFASYDFAWPTVVGSAYSVLSAFNLNLELASPECSVGWDYETKWYIMYFMPMVFGLLFTTGFIVQFIRYSVSNLKRKIRMKAGMVVPLPAADAENEDAEIEKALLVDDDDMESYDESFNRFIDAEFGAFLLMCYYLYLSVMKKCFEIFRCTDGEVPLLRAEPSEPCNDSGDFYMKLRALSVFGIFLYGIGIPLVITYLLLKHQSFIKKDQKRREQALKLSDNEAARRVQSAFRGYYVRRVVDPRAILKKHKLLTNIGRTRAKFGKLYEDFTADCYYWRVVLMMRKLILVMITMFLDDKFKQATLAFAVLFSSYAIQVKKRPYLNRFPDDREKRKQAKAYQEWKRRAALRSEVQKTAGRVRALQEALSKKMTKLGISQAADDRVLRENMDFTQLRVSKKAGDIVRNQEVVSEILGENDGNKTPAERRWKMIQTFVRQVDNQDKFELNTEAAQYIKTDALRWLFDYNTLETISLATLMYILLFGLLFDTYAAQSDDVRINLLATITIALFCLVIILFMSSVVIDVKRKFWPVLKERLLKEGIRSVMKSLFEPRAKSNKVQPGPTVKKRSVDIDSTKAVLGVPRRGQWVSPVNPFATLERQNADVVRAEEARLRALMASKMRHQEEMQERQLQREEEKARLEEEYRLKMESVDQELRALQEQEEAFEEELAKTIDEEVQDVLGEEIDVLHEDDGIRKPDVETELEVEALEQERVSAKAKAEEEQLRIEEELLYAQVQAEKRGNLTDLKQRQEEDLSKAIKDLRRQAEDVLAEHQQHQDEIKARLMERNLRRPAEIRRRKTEAQTREEKIMLDLEEKASELQERQHAEIEEFEAVTDTELEQRLIAVREEVRNRIEKEFEEDEEFERSLSSELDTFQEETREQIAGLEAPKITDDMSADEAERLKKDYKTSLDKLMQRRKEAHEALKSKLEAKRQNRLLESQKEDMAKEGERLTLLEEANARAEKARLREEELEVQRNLDKTTNQKEVEELRAKFEQARDELQRKQETQRDERRAAIEKRLDARKRAMEAKKQQKLREAEQKEKEAFKLAAAAVAPDSIRDDAEVASHLEKIKKDAIEKKKLLEDRIRGEKSAQREKLKERLQKKRKQAEERKQQMLEQKKREEDEMNRKLLEEERMLKEKQALELEEIEQARIEVFLDETQEQSLAAGVNAWRKQREEQEKKKTNSGPKRSEILSVDFAAKAQRIEELAAKEEVTNSVSNELQRLVKELDSLYVNLVEERDAELNKLTNEAAVEKARQKRKLQTLKRLIEPQDDDIQDESNNEEKNNTSNVVNVDIANLNFDL